MTVIHTTNVRASLIEGSEAGKAVNYAYDFSDILGDVQNTRGFFARLDVNMQPVAGSGTITIKKGVAWVKYTKTSGATGLLRAELTADTVLTLTGEADGTLYAYILLDQTKVDDGSAEIDGGDVWSLRVAGALPSSGSYLPIATLTKSGSAITIAADSRERIKIMAGTIIADQILQNDGNLAGGNWKQPVEVATTANITLSGTQTIDGIAVTVGQRVLVKDQSTASANGIYVVAAGAWGRATDADASAEMNAALVVIKKGASNANTLWQQTADDPTIGTTALTWIQVGASTAKASDTDVIGGVEDTKFTTSRGTKLAIDAFVKRQLTATFSEDITSGTPVAFKNGQVVKSFSRYGVTPSYSAAPFTPLTNNVGMRSCKLANGRIVTVKSTGSSGSVNFSAQTSDVDANGIFTNATATGWSGGMSGIVPQAFDIARLDDTHFIVFYQVNSTSTAVFYNIGTVATNGLITMAGQTTLASSGLVTSILSTLRCATIANNKIVCSYAGPGLLGATVVTWNGTAITAGSPSLSPIVPVGTYDIDTCKVDTDKFAIVHLMGSYTVAVVVATVSGTTISPWGTQTNTSVAAINSRPLAASQVSAGKIAIGFGVSGVGYRALISTVSGTTPAFGLPATIGTPDTAVNNGGLQFCQNGDGAFIARHFSSSNIRINFIAVSGTSMAMNEQSYAATSLTYATTLLLLNSYVGQLIFGFVNASVYETLCAGNFQASNGIDGFANATTSAAASGVVDLAGKENTSQSGLTAATRYFVNYDNALTATQDGTNTPRAGIALSATSILIMP